MAKTYAERVENFQNETARKLLQCIERKKSNLCVAVDVTRKTELLDIVDKVGPYICLLKVGIQCASVVSMTTFELLLLLCNLDTRRYY